MSIANEIDTKAANPPDPAKPRRRYYACTFPGAKSGRRYTYHYDGSENFKFGDEVLVDAPRDEGFVRVIIQTELGMKPKFDTKPIHKRAPAEEES